MRLLRLYIALLLSSTFFYACSDFEETDLSEETVVLLAPGDCTTNDENSQLFVWEDLTEDDPDLDVEYYNLQIAEPDFTSPLRFVLDSNVNGTSYEMSIKPGDYEWRVRAENSSSRTLYTTNRLYVDSSFILTGQTIVLLTPNDATEFTFEDQPEGNFLTFTWEPLAGVTEYQFDIVKGRFSSSGKTIKSIPSTQLTSIQALIPKTSTVDQDGGIGNYEWRVIARNASNGTTTNNSRTFSFDTLDTTVK